MPYKSKEARLIRDRKYRKQNPERIREAARKYRENNREKLRTYNAQNNHKYLEIARSRRAALYEYLAEIPCEICGKLYHPVCMDFHHIDPSSKIKGIKALTGNTRVDKLFKEIDKCALVCSHCHRLFHAGIITHTFN